MLRIIKMYIYDKKDIVLCIICMMRFKYGKEADSYLVDMPMMHM